MKPSALIIPCFFGLLTDFEAKTTYITDFAGRATNSKALTLRRPLGKVWTNPCPTADTY